MIKMGEHMEPVVELLEELNGNNTDAKLKLLALVISEYMLNADVTGFEVTAGKMKVSVDISVEEEPRLHIKERPRKKVDRCDVCTEGARGGCGTCIYNGNFE
ncbi:hypothetical protein [Klebsiella pneumoniae]|uniref:hypothetical protein n=1 Tax=Klebsiella pneumoniae TaxID=573 RepID=UPI000E2DB624|nr:hypothetical protein [Klebsiella pneumoniae]SYC34111.1 Uncharacterised protein [Klebsiella pneumoniae]